MKVDYRYFFLLALMLCLVPLASAVGANGACTSASQCSIQPSTCVVQISGEGTTCKTTINLPLGSSCTYGYQCLSNNCFNHFCSSSQATGLIDGSSCTADSNCASGSCMQELDGVHKTCRTPKSVQQGGSCVASAQCASTQCVNYKCAYSTDSQLPINLQNGVSCTYNYQCLTNYCDTTKHCAITQATNLINGASCSINANCRSNYCVYSDPTKGGTGGKVCADPNAPSQVNSVGQPCGDSFEGVQRVCQSNLMCEDHVCIVPGSFEPCNGIDPSCLITDLATKASNTIGASSFGFASGLFSNKITATLLTLLIIWLLWHFVIRRFV